MAINEVHSSGKQSELGQHKWVGESAFHSQ